MSHSLFPLEKLSQDYSRPLAREPSPGAIASPAFSKPRKTKTWVIDSFPGRSPPLTGDLIDASCTLLQGPRQQPSLDPRSDDELQWDSTNNQVCKKPEYKPGLRPLRSLPQMKPPSVSSVKAPARSISCPATKARRSCVDRGRRADPVMAGMPLEMLAEGVPQQRRLHSCMVVSIALHKSTCYCRVL